MKLRILSAVLPALLLSAAAAEAHIKLTYPPSWIMENSTGDPQKNGPCGGPATRSNVRTRFRPGETIMVQFTETIHHPGHFRISFDDNGTDAFKDPTSFTDIVEPPVMPILKDGLLKDHQAGQPLMVPITLPNVTCSTCTLQIIQVMTDKPPYQPGGNDIYYHCADIELAADGGGAADGGVRDGGRRDGGRAPDARPPMGGTGGSAGTGGSGGSGGAAATGGSGGGTAGTGGSAPVAGAGGRGGSPATAGTGGSPPPASTGDDSGGFCSIGGRGHQSAFALAFIGLLGSVLWRARRRRPR
jgi:hypothetical protein